MAPVPDRSRQAAKPFTIARDGAGGYRLILCETRYNSMNYPLVTETAIEATFATAAAARAYAKEHFGANAGEFSMPPRKPA